MTEAALDSVDEVHDYKERYVAFLDLLGFKVQVKVAEETPSQWLRLREILALVRDTLCENPAIGMRLTWFSDCIVFSADRSEQGLAEMIQAIETLTCNLLQYDVLVRGGLVAGGAHHGKDFVYGTAVGRAYEMESTCAKWPITLVSLEVLDDARTYSAPLMDWLIEDGADRHFVHYLSRYATYRPKPIYSGMVIMDDPAQRVTDFICRRLNQDAGTVLEKAQWFAAYWNRTVAIEGVFGPIEQGMVPKGTSRGPTLMVRRIVGPARAGPSIPST